MATHFCILARKIPWTEKSGGLQFEVKVIQSCPTLCNPGQNTGVGNLSLLQGILPIQGSNLGLLNTRRATREAWATGYGAANSQT